MYELLLRHYWPSVGRQVDSAPSTQCWGTPHPSHHQPLCVLPAAHSSLMHLAERSFGGSCKLASTAGLQTTCMYCCSGAIGPVQGIDCAPCTQCLGTLHPSQHQPMCVLLTAHCSLMHLAERSGACSCSLASTGDLQTTRMNCC